MADVVAVRTMLQRIGFSQNAAAYCTDSIQLASLTKIRNMQADEELIGLAKNIRNPGGNVQGHAVDVRAIGNFKILRIVLRHYHHIQRTVDIALIGEDWLLAREYLIEYYKSAKTKYAEVELPKINMNDWAHTQEEVLNAFGEIYGSTGIPLSYLLREDDLVPAEANDPQANYNEDIVAEMIARAPHTGKAFKNDNRTLCSLIKKMTINTSAHTYVTNHSANGRDAWKVLMANYLGPQHTQNQATIYEEKLKSSHYDGASNRFTFATLVDIHKDAHTRLDKLERHGYKGMDEGTKIRHLLHAIKDPSLQQIVELVRGNPQFDTFDKTVRRLNDKIAITIGATRKRGRNISSVSRGGKLHPRYDGVEADYDVEIRYYKGSEWAKLPLGKQKAVLLQRQGRKGGKGKQKGKDSEKAARATDVKKLNRQVKKLERQLASVTVNDADSDTDSSSDSEAEVRPKKKSKKTTNRNNPSTTRRR